MSAFCMSLLGGVIAALVGAASAWGFALDLRRRDRQQQYHSAMNVAVADVATCLEGLDGAAKAFQFSFGVGDPAVPAEPPHRARARLMSAIRVAQMTARGQDIQPIHEVLTIATRQDAVSTQGLVDLLVDWQRGEITAAEAAARIRALSSAGSVALDSA